MAAVTTLARTHLAVTPVPVGLGTYCQDRSNASVSTAQHIDECSSLPCQNGGACRNLINAYRCDCQPGWSGVNCQGDTNECSSNNGGWTTLARTHLAVTPVPVGLGTYCQDRSNASVSTAQHINECSSLPCQNGGACRNLINAYRCDCQPGWSGVNCQGDIDECFSSPCQNGGTCRNLINAYRCDCQPGWSGVNCQGETPTTLHNSLCYKLSGAAKNQQSSEQECAAKGGTLAAIRDTSTQSFVAALIRENDNVSHWIGIKQPPVTFLYYDFSIVQDQQLWAPNQPSTLCVYMDSGENYKFSVAVCSEEHGFVCQSDIDECSSFPCVNGGTCLDGDNSYICTCPQGYVGENCENDLDLCNPNPCPFNWNCVDNGGHLTCGTK
ncbi:hypothetical protein Bbelb_065200, partial [Branchiostoma belcheri]